MQRYTSFGFVELSIHGPMVCSAHGKLSCQCFFFSFRKSVQPDRHFYYLDGKQCLKGLAQRRFIENEIDSVGGIARDLYSTHKMSTDF